MSDEAPEGTPAQDNPEDTTDWKAQSRKWEDRAKANKAEADRLDALVKELTPKAARLDEIEAEHATALQAEKDRADAAEQKLRDREEQDRAAQEAAEREQAHTDLVNEIAEKAGVPAAALVGDTREALEAHAEVLKPLINKPLVIENQGDIPDSEPTENRAFVRGFFGGDDE